MSTYTYFAHDSAARRYARGRPYFHPVVIGKIAARLGAASPVDRALDVACGTGQSATALTAIARRVVASDVSADMLAHATRDPRIDYVRAAAELMPFDAATFGLMTVSLAIHWFDQPRFLTEAARVLRPGGWLVIYQNGFFGRMRENDAYARWNAEVYLRRYPTPPRNARPLTGDDARVAGFEPMADETYANDVTFTGEQLVTYLLTQSNVIAAVEQGAQDVVAVAAWLAGEVAPLFPSSGRATFEFGGSIRYLRRT